MGCNCQATIDEIMLENNELSQKVGDQYKTIEMLKDILRERERELELAALSKKH